MSEGDRAAALRLAVAQNEALSFLKSFDAVEDHRYKRYVTKFEGRDPDKNAWLIVALGLLAYELGVRLEIAEKKPLEDIIAELSREVGKNIPER